MVERVTVAEWLTITGGTHLKDDVRELARLGDRGTLSIQASRYHYCEPQVDQAREYRAVEIGGDGVLDGPLDPSLWLAPYLLELPRTVLFAKVPIALAEKYVAARGGIVIERVAAPVARSSWTRRG
ncbi:MAG: hypothetical protein AB7O57_04990 [Hyphomicrobiaceae bacterium]